MKKVTFRRFNRSSHKEVKAETTKEKEMARIKM